MAKVEAGCGHVFDIDTCESDLKMVCGDADCRKVYEQDFARENNDLCPDDSEELNAERVYKCSDCGVWYPEDALDPIEDEPEVTPVTT